jgi:hypothetical protein
LKYDANNGGSFADYQCSRVKKRIEKKEKNAFSIPKRSANDEITYLFKGKKSHIFSSLFAVERFLSN